MNLSVNRRGFTIVELLIVVVILAILVTITIVAFNGIQGRAIDSRRVSDIRAISKGLEMYRITNGNFPTLSYSGAGSIFQKV